MAKDAQNEDSSWYMIERHYGTDPTQGWEYCIDHMFATKQAALEFYWDEELEDGVDITTLEFPEDIRIVKISRA